MAATVALAFLVGFWSLAAQFVFNRIVFFYLANSDFAAAAIISVHLSGFLLGSLAAPRLRFSLTGLLAASAALSCLAAMLCWRLGAPVFGLGPTVVLTVACGVALAALSGALFMKLIGQARGANWPQCVVIADSAGSVLGAVVAGFLLIPHAGLTASFAAVLALQAVSVLVAGIHERAARWAMTGVAAAGVAAGMAWMPFTAQQGEDLSERLMADGLAIADPTGGQGRLMFSEVSPYGLVSVVETPSSTTMLLDSKPLCGVQGEDLPGHFQYNLGNFPAKLARDVRSPRAAIVGLGCGFTLSGLLEGLPRAAAVDVVEINPVVEKAQKAFQRIVPDTVADTRVSVTIEDGFRYFALREGQPRYDLVVMDISWMHDMVSTHLFSVEMFRNIRRNLTSEGVLTLHMAGVGPFAPSSRLVYRTLKAVFPHVYVDLVEGVTVFHATARKDAVNYLPIDGARVSGWLAELGEDGPVNALDRLPLSGERMFLLWKKP